MRFRRDNQIRYGQDHFQHRGIPAGVDFAVERFKEKMFILTAHGYGCWKRDRHCKRDCYGNGALFVWGLTARQRARFEAAADAARKDGES
jgi:hypothetical protein